MDVWGDLDSPRHAKSIHATSRLLSHDNKALRKSFREVAAAYVDYLAGMLATWREVLGRSFLGIHGHVVSRKAAQL